MREECDMDLKFSAIIPTYNRPEDLARCLKSLLEQDISPQQYEVIIVNDGGSNDLESIMTCFKPHFGENLVYIYQENRGPAVARNHALVKVRSELILFLNDDVIFAPDYLNAHLRAHQRQPGHAVRGNTRWHPDVLYTPFMQWISQNVLFYYLIDDLMSITYEYFHTLDLSIHRRWFEHDRFDEAFTDASLEDTELGFRLMKKGLHLQFAPDAICYHYHYYDFQNHLQKMKINARNSILVVERHPELKERLISYYTEKSFSKRFLDTLRYMFTAKKETPFVWKFLTEKTIHRAIKSILS